MQEQAWGESVILQGAFTTFGSSRVFSKVRSKQWAEPGDSGRTFKKGVQKCGGGQGVGKVVQQVT